MTILVIVNTIFAVIGSIVVALIQAHAKNTKKRLDQIHVLVNSRLTETVQRVEKLTAQLERAGITPQN